MKTTACALVVGLTAAGAIAPMHAHADDSSRTTDAGATSGGAFGARITAGPQWIAPRARGGSRVSTPDGVAAGAMSVALAVRLGRYFYVGMEGSFTFAAHAGSDRIADADAARGITDGGTTWTLLSGIGGVRVPVGRLVLGTEVGAGYLRSGETARVPNVRNAGLLDTHQSFLLSPRLTVGVPIDGWMHLFLMGELDIAASPGAVVGVAYFAGVSMGM